MINIFSSSRYKVNKKNIKEFAQAVLDGYQVTNLGVINIVFVGKRKMKDIANTYKHENVALPVLAFPYEKDKQSDEHIIGEVIICYPQAVLLAAEREKKVEDVMKQLIEHGIGNLYTK
jgi:rRNA maturation RNase YbeY